MSMLEGGPASLRTPIGDGKELAEPEAVVLEYVLVV